VVDVVGSRAGPFASLTWNLWCVGICCYFKIAVGCINDQGTRRPLVDIVV